MAVGPKKLAGSEETPPTRRIAVSWDRAKALATDQKRNVQLDLAMIHL